MNANTDNCIKQEEEDIRRRPVKVSPPAQHSEDKVSEHNIKSNDSRATFQSRTFQEEDEDKYRRRRLVQDISNPVQHPEQKAPEQSPRPLLDIVYYKWLIILGFGLVVGTMLFTAGHVQTLEASTKFLQGVTVFLEKITKMLSSPSASPAVSLTNFVNNVETTYVESDEIEKIMKMPLSKFRLYAGAACRTGQTQKAVKTAMALKFSNLLPEGVRDKVLKGAFVEGITSVIDATQDTVFDSGKADTFYAFYHTEVNSEETKSCILVTGVGYNVAETVAAWREEYIEKVIGYEETCDNGLVARSCTKKPIIVKELHRIPEYKSSALNHKEVDAMTAIMMRDAVQAAKPLRLNNKIAQQLTDGGGNTLGWKPLPSK